MYHMYIIYILSVIQALTLKESLQIDQLPAIAEEVPTTQYVPQPAATQIQPVAAVTTDADTQQQMMPVSYAMAEPLNEAELTALLMTSPLYHKIEEMKRTLTGGNVRIGHKPVAG